MLKFIFNVLHCFYTLDDIDKAWRQHRHDFYKSIGRT